MSKAFPTDKDNVISSMEDEYDLTLTEEEYDRLRKLKLADLFLLSVLLARAEKNRSRSESHE